jgi:hypothetical protein
MERLIVLRDLVLFLVGSVTSLTGAGPDNNYTAPAKLSIQALGYRQL